MKFFQFICYVILNLILSVVLLLSTAHNSFGYQCVGLGSLPQCGSDGGNIEDPEQPIDPELDDFIDNASSLSQLLDIAGNDPAAFQSTRTSANDYTVWLNHHNNIRSALSSSQYTYLVDSINNEIQGHEQSSSVYACIEKKKLGYKKTLFQMAWNGPDGNINYGENRLFMEPINDECSFSYVTKRNTWSNLWILFKMWDKADYPGINSCYSDCLPNNDPCYYNFQAVAPYSPTDVYIYQSDPNCSQRHLDYACLTDDYFAVVNADVVTIGECFAAGTKVMTDSGLVNIESILEGDMVLSMNVRTGETDYKKVLSKSVKNSYMLTSLTVNGETITSSRSHPYWKGVYQSSYFKYPMEWTPAMELQQGDILINSDKQELSVNSAPQVVEYNDAQIVYDLTVEDWSTYFVGQNKVFVHNDPNCNAMDSVNDYVTVYKGNSSKVQFVKIGELEIPGWVFEVGGIRNFKALPIELASEWQSYCDGNQSEGEAYARMISKIAIMIAKKEAGTVNKMLNPFRRLKWTFKFLDLALDKIPTVNQARAKNSEYRTKLSNLKNHCSGSHSPGSSDFDNCLIDNDQDYGVIIDYN